MKVQKKKDLEDYSQRSLQGRCANSNRCYSTDNQ